jgi:hypothetical protein
MISRPPGFSTRANSQDEQSIASCNEAPARPCAQDKRGGQGPGSGVGPAGARSPCDIGAGQPYGRKRPCREAKENSRLQSVCLRLKLSHN